jgi:hypothetical protein
MSELDKIQTNPISRSSKVEHVPGVERRISREERDGVSSTDLDRRPALGVGESVSHRGEDFSRRAGAGRHGRGRTGAQPPRGDQGG